MKRLIGIGLMFVFAAGLVSCGGGQNSSVDESATASDTMSESDTLSVEDTMAPAPEVREIFESDFQIVYFDFDKFNIKEEFRITLENNADLMHESMNLVVQIEGHCDERGTVEYNLSLGEKRANAAKNYLLNLGIAESRIQVISYGKERSAMMGHNEAAWSKNRRAEFRIISQ